MTTTKHQPRQISLRALARELLVNHSSLSAAAHDGRLTRGVRVADDGRVAVTDADAAAADWRSIHVPRIVAAARPRALWDEALSRYVTAEQLFAERNALSVLVTALTAEVLNGDDRSAVPALAERIAAQLRDVAELHGADDGVLACAQGDLHSAIDMLFDKDDEEEATETEENT